jgi:hypothetical protein
MSSEKTGDLADLAYELSLRTLSQQEKILDELRARTGILLAATAFVTSFLGARALQDTDLKWLGLLGVAAAVISILICVYVQVESQLRDRRSRGLRIFLSRRRRSARSAPNARVLEWRGEANQTIVDWLIRCFGIACGGLVMAVLLWSLKLSLN